MRERPWRPHSRHSSIRRIPEMKEGGPEAAFQLRDGAVRYFTPCISFWISGAIRNSTTPAPIRIQNPIV